MQYQLRVMQVGQAPKHYMVDAVSAQQAIHQAEQQGYVVLNVEELQQQLFRQFFRTKHIQFPLILFCQEFRVLFEAGLAVVEVLQTLIDKEANAATKQLLESLYHAVQEGKTLSQAMALNTQAFPSLLVATVSAAETTGDLAEALLRYGQYLESVDSLKKKIVSATLYPAIVTGFGVLVFIFLVVFVIPRFSKIYATQVKTVSATTQFLLNLGEFSQQYGLAILILLVALIMLSFVAMRNEANRAKLSDMLWKIPYLGEYIRVYYLARFYRTFSMLLKSGIPVMTGLGMVDNLLGVRLKRNLTQAKRAIAEGQSFSHALVLANLTTPVAIRLFNVGEKTGTLDQMMERSASFHEEQMVRWIDRFTKVFEPTLMAIIGLLIGGIVLMMYMPIFELASGIQ